MELLLLLGLALYLYWYCFSARATHTLVQARPVLVILAIATGLLSMLVVCVAACAVLAYSFVHKTPDSNE